MLAMPPSNFSIGKNTVYPGETVTCTWSPATGDFDSYHLEAFEQGFFVIASASLPTTANWMDAAYGAGKFVAISQGVNGAAGNAFVYSTNGITWTAGTMPASALWYKITYGNGVFIASASNKSYVGYSTDGVNWTTKTLPVSKSWRTLLFGDGEFVMVGYNSNVALHSKDGINWTQSEIPLTKNWLYCAYGDKKFAFTAQGYSAVYSK